MPGTPSLSGKSAAATMAHLLTIPTATNPVWFSERRLLYLSDVSGVPQLWAVDFDQQVPGTSTQPFAVTTLTDRVGSLVSSRTGDLAVFGMDTGGDERAQLWRLDDTGPRALTADPGTIHTLGAISPDGTSVAFASNTRARHAFDVLTLDLTDANATPVPVMATDELLTPVAWTPDGRSLVVERANTNLDHDLFLVPADGGQATLLTPHTGEASISHVAASSSGTSLYFLSNQDREFSALIELDLETHEQTEIASFDWDIEALAVAPDGDWLAYVVNVDGFSRVILREIATGGEREVGHLPAGVISGPQWSPNGSRLAFAVSGAQHPASIWVCDRNGQARSVTGSSIQQETSFVAAETVRFTTFDGREIPAYWYRPTGEGPWPVVVEVHGGPESQRRPDFLPTTQGLVAAGIAVLSTNVRGSTGYGKTYCHLDDVERRMDSVADLQAAVTWLREQPAVIGDRIAVMGQSYGGFMVLAALTTYPEIWAAGVEVVGIANFVSFLEQTGPWRRKTRAAEYGDLERDAALLREISPLHKADRITAPLFIIHGRNDPRVPLGETEQIATKLRELGREVELMIFDDEGHGMVKRPNRQAGFGRAVEFLVQYLIG
jgi:dipeptidyl aminopeptidase/acylaminoacyl peptidase